MVVWWFQLEHPPMFDFFLSLTSSLLLLWSHKLFDIVDEDFMSINPFDVLIDWLISLFRAFCFITKEFLFNVDGLETFTLQLVWRKINPPFILSNPPWNSFKKFLSPIQSTLLLSKLFLAPIHKKVYSIKLIRNWNASMCVEK